MKFKSLKTQGFLLFDIDGVIRDVTKSYRSAIKETVHQFGKWRPKTEDIDNLKLKGIWNNDWDLSHELIKNTQQVKDGLIDLPSREEIIKVFNNFYFGCDPNNCKSNWTGFINNENLLVDIQFFDKLTEKNISYGFVSGAERPSAKFILESRLGLNNPSLIAMEDAPEKPDPKGLISLAKKLVNEPLGQGIPPIGYLGDTIADALTVKNAQKIIPDQKFIFLGVAPPHLHKPNKKSAREIYERNLIKAGADIILKSTSEAIDRWPPKL